MLICTAVAAAAVCAAAAPRVPPCMRPRADFRFFSSCIHACPVAVTQLCVCASDAYFLFDLPGQVELYTHHAGMKSIVDKMTNAWNMRVGARGG